MTPILAKDVVTHVRQILNDASAAKFTEAMLVVNMKSAERWVKQTWPAACYTSPVAFDEGSTLSPSGTAGALADTDTIDMDVTYQDRMVHYTAYLTFAQSTRDKVNLECADRELKYAMEAS